MKNNINFYQRTQKWKYALFIVASIIATASLLLTNMLVYSLEDFTNDLKRNERTQIQTWASATKHLSNMSPDSEGDFSFSMEIIKKNISIPTILIDECENILLYKNIYEIDQIDSLFNASIDSLRQEKEKYIQNIKTDQDFLLLSIEEQIKMIDNIKEEYNNRIYDKISEKDLKISPILQSSLESMRSRIDIDSNPPIEIYVAQDTQKLYYKNSKKVYETKEMLNQLKYYPYYQIAFISLFAFLAYLIFNAARKSEQNRVWAGMAKETAHQIATPLSSLIAWVELLKDKKENEEMTKEMTKDLERLEIITERFSKIGSAPKLIKQDLLPIIKETIQYLKNRFQNNISFNLDADQESYTIAINKTLLIWVIENICKNAIDAMKGEGSITLSCYEDVSDFKLFISDTGPGINKNIIKSIFMPGVTSKTRGWGLGLSLSKRIIEEYHKGKIWVESSNKIEGTTFCILLKK